VSRIRGSDPLALGDPHGSGPPERRFEPSFDGLAIATTLPAPLGQASRESMQTACFPRRPDVSNSNLPPRFLRTSEAARFLSLSGRTLEKHRSYGTGPLYRKVGGRVIYALTDLVAWAERGARRSTSDLVADAPRPAQPERQSQAGRQER